MSSALDGKLVWKQYEKGKCGGKSPSDCSKCPVGLIPLSNWHLNPFSCQMISHRAWWGGWSMTVQSKRLPSVTSNESPKICVNCLAGISQAVHGVCLAKKRGIGSWCARLPPRSSSYCPLPMLGLLLALFSHELPPNTTLPISEGSLIATCVCVRYLWLFALMVLACMSVTWLLTARLGIMVADCEYHHQISKPKS